MSKHMLDAKESKTGTAAAMDDVLDSCGYENNMADGRLHREIYLSDPRETEPTKRKIVIKRPIRKIVIQPNISNPKLQKSFCLTTVYSVYTLK